MVKKRHKHKGMRTCIACGKQVCKWQLLRIVRTSSSCVLLDVTNKAPGRGAYVCSLSCFNDASKKHKFDRALKTKISENNYNKIASDITVHLSAVENR